jgi:hypothetical protein
MRSYFKPNMPALIGAVLLCSMQFNTLVAQDNSNVKEPPIPIYIMSSVREDSASSGSRQVDSQFVMSIISKADTLQQLIHTASAENTVHFIWLYSLIALLGIMNIVLLYSTSSIRKELAQVKRLEHQKLLLSAESSALSQSLPIAEETPKDFEPSKIKPAVKPRKPRTYKPRVKKVKQA